MGCDCSKHWALIVAGSKGKRMVTTKENKTYEEDNYRHQADVCHAYHLLRNHGIEEERIVIMMYDDVAALNKGVIRNHPKGPNVYRGVTIDYRGGDVTPQHFLDILQGNQASMKGIGSGRVIESNSSNHVFVNFVGHGGAGIVGFPNNLLHANELVNTIKQMYKDGKYYEMALYFEACHSGSMFENHLPSNINCYAMTACNKDESSFACYYSEKEETFLGDLYSVIWMEYSDENDLTKKTLSEQFEFVKTKTRQVVDDYNKRQQKRKQPKQTAERFGNMDTCEHPVANFQGYVSPDSEPLAKVSYYPIESENVSLAIRQYKHDATDDLEKKRKIMVEITAIVKECETIRRAVEKIVERAGYGGSQRDRMFSTRQKISDYARYKGVMTLFHEKCFDLRESEYAMRHLYVLVNLCEEGVPVTRIHDAIHATALDIGTL